MKLFSPRRYNAGDGKRIAIEPSLEKLAFTHFKFNNRRRPENPRRILFVTCFFEFGCESIGLMYCIPKILQTYPDCYVICVGWYGREYLYRHLVDEFWEIKEEFQWLREYAIAFRHGSRNIEKLESALEKQGVVFKGAYMGHICLGNTCRNCKNFWSEENEDMVCPKCGSDQVNHGLLNDIPYHKKLAIQIPRPSLNSIAKAKSYLKPNPVGIFARGRLCYGRNLPADFYVSLIKLLEDRGYNPIWLGEKQSVLPCPVPHITDFSRLPEARDLELTLAIISQLSFTVQFWTASTRFASAMGTPWLLFESPDQICGNGQEGKRIALTSDPNKKKLVVSQFFNVLENQEAAIDLVDQAISEMKADNWNDIVGLVNEPALITAMLSKQDLWRA